MPGCIFPSIEHGPGGRPYDAVNPVATPTPETDNDLYTFHTMAADVILDLSSRAVVSISS
jgi:hypothetical protein